MTQEQKKLILERIEKVLNSHENVEVNFERSRPDVIWDEGFPEFIPTAINQTITITSVFYFNPKKEILASK